MTPVNDQCSCALTGIATAFAEPARRSKNRNVAIGRDSAPPPTESGRAAAGCHPPDPSPTTTVVEGSGGCHLK
jgi:hypothetical protein